MSTIEIDLFGDFRILENGAAAELPPSKKARALLAYLIVTDRPQRREHLCELFWDTPHDPKGSLRWALSKLRASFSEETRERFKSDRERVSFDMSGISNPIAEVQVLLDTPNPPKDVLFEIKKRLERDFLAGLDLSRMDQFALWLGEQREATLRLKGQFFQKMLQCKGLDAVQKLQLSREWVENSPYDGQAATTLITVLRQQNLALEAERLEKEFNARFKGLDIKFDTAQSEVDVKPNPIQQDRALLSHQKIQFCKTSGGVTLAHASVGSGPPLVKAANWLTHLELDWSAPIWSPLYRELAQDFTFIRYDERGNGLSDWNVDELSQDIFVKDLECVVDNLGLEKFPLLGISQGAAVSIEYAIRHPERVSKLILFGGYPKGWRVEASAETILEREAMITLTKTGWGQNNPAYRHVFSSTFMPTASARDLAWFDDFQRQTTSPDNAVKFLQAFADIDVRHHLPNIKVPTLVIHSRGDQRIDWSVGRDIAAEIPNAELVTLDSDNHLLLEGEPAADQFLAAVRAFLLD